MGELVKFIPLMAIAGVVFLGIVYVKNRPGKFSLIGITLILLSLFLGFGVLLSFSDFLARPRIDWAEGAGRGFFTFVAGVACVALFKKGLFLMRGQNASTWSNDASANLNDLRPDMIGGRSVLAILGVILAVILIERGAPNLPDLSTQTPIAELNCSDLHDSIQSIKLKNTLGGEWSILKVLSSSEITRLEDMMSCKVRLLTEMGEGDYRVTVSPKGGELFIEVEQFF